MGIVQIKFAVGTLMLAILRTIFHLRFSKKATKLIINFWI